MLKNVILAFFRISVKHLLHWPLYTFTKVASSRHSWSYLTDRTQCAYLHDICFTSLQIKCSIPHGLIPIVIYYMYIYIIYIYIYILIILLRHRIYFSFLCLRVIPTYFLFASHSHLDEWLRVVNQDIEMVSNLIKIKLSLNVTKSVILFFHNRQKKFPWNKFQINSITIEQVSLSFWVL